MKVAYTISTANYLSLAKTVGDSFLKHNPDYQFTIFLYDKVDGRFNVSYFSPIRIIEIESLQLSAFDEMVNKYSIFEMCNALKPFVAEYIFENYSAKMIIYVDSDLMFYDSLEVLEDALEKFDIIITPHVSTPIPLDGYGPDEKSFLLGGIYNGGFFVLKLSEESLAFLKWWKSRLEKYCFVNYAEGLFVDQKWMNFIPVYFKTAFVLGHPGYNIGHWNLHERFLKNVQGKYFANSNYSLVFFHFSGYDIMDSKNISKYQNRFTFESRPDLIDIFNNYTDIVLENKSDQFSKLQCIYIEVKRKAAATAEINRKKNQAKLFKRKIKSKLKNLLNMNHCFFLLLLTEGHLL